MPESKIYKLDIDPRILELLGPSLYTNIYYVLAELIANAYDADAENVYIIQEKESIIVEDDGSGMSYERGDINKYLGVAKETRTTKEDTYTIKKKRRKIGRKGVGKLAALSVSENVHVMTVKNREKSGFVLSRHVNKDHTLRPIKEKDIAFKMIKGNGTSIIMKDPHYGLHKTPSAVKNNLFKILPLVSKDFRIHLIIGKERDVIDDFDHAIIKSLGALVILGERFYNLSEFFNPQLPEGIEEKEERLLIKKPIEEIPVTMKNKAGEKNTYPLKIEGWIGAYRSTRDRKLNRQDFPDNFVSLISNGKLGEYNILPAVGKNALIEVFIVGQLHIDLFEETELPDMALSNRQGYKTDDPRYQAVEKYVRDTLLPKIVALRNFYADILGKEKKKAKLKKQEEEERKLKEKVEKFGDIILDVPTFIPYIRRQKEGNEPCPYCPHRTFTMRKPRTNLLKPASGPTARFARTAARPSA